MEAKILDCLHVMPKGYRYALCPKCIEKVIAKSLEEGVCTKFAKEAEDGYDLCLDGHEWSGILVNKDGAYKMCLVCNSGAK